MTRRTAHKPNWLLIPLKARQHAKSRLSPLLSPARRQALQQAMIADMLDGLARSTRLSGIALYGPDPVTREMARSRGLLFLRPPGHVSDLNGAIADGVSRLMLHDPGTISVLPGDLPLADGQELDAAIAHVARSACCAVVPDRARLGTNGLVFPAGTPPAFCFGPGSFALHMSDIPPRTPRHEMALPSLAGDIDTPKDLIRLGLNGNTVRGLRSRALAQRPFEKEIQT